MANLFDSFQMNKKVSELDSTKARLRLLLDQSVVVSKNNSSEQQKSSKNHEKTETTNSTTTKSENHRVHFDLNNATTNSSSAENIRKPARTSRPNGRSTNVHLPSDARQKLEQLVIRKIPILCQVVLIFKTLSYFSGFCSRCNSAFTR